MNFFKSFTSNFFKYNKKINKYIIINIIYNIMKKRIDTIIII